MFCGSLLLWSTACGQRVAKLLERGDYTAAFDLSLERVQQRDVPKKRHLADLFASFDALQQRELAALRDFNPTQDAAQRAEVFYRYDRLYERARLVDRYRPLGAPAGYRTGASLRSLARERETVRLNAGQYFWDRAQRLLPTARDGDKIAARTAFAELGSALEFLPERSAELDALRAEMEELGLVRVFVYAVEGNLDPSLLADFTQTEDSYQHWLEIVFRDEGRRIDYEAEVFLDRYEVAGPSVSTASTTYSEEVLDWVEEKEKQVRQGDTTITVVEKIEHYRTVSATVVEIEQEMDLWLHGELVLFRSGAEEPYWVTNWATHEDWENEYSICSGDEEALPFFGCSGMEMTPPAARQLLVRAAGHVDGVMRREIRKFFASATPQHGENDLRE